jgi:hypothetical protein
MKSKSTYVLQMMLSMVLVGPLFFVLALPVDAYGNIAPKGTKIGAVQFDAIIELNRYSPHSWRHDYTMIFARYWVARDYYSAAIVWAEPQSTDIFFTIHPPSLLIVSNEQSFKVCHESINKDNEMYIKPLGERGVLRHKFGGYPIGKIRFTEREALTERIYESDLKGLKDINTVDGEVLKLSILDNERVYKRDVSQLKMKTNGEHIDSMQLFNADKRLLKDISYEYETKRGKTHLRRQTVVLPEQPIMVGFKGEGIKVTLDGKEYQYRDLKATHHMGGRKCIIEYETVTLGDQEVPLPVKVTVYNQKDRRILRCVRVMNFKQVELDTTDTEEAARRFCAVTADHIEYRKLREKYWKKDQTEIEKKDIEIIEQLCDRFEKELAAADKNTGEKLKNLNALIELDRIIGDESEIERHYQNYLSTLRDSKLTQMTLVGGYGVIETSMFRGRRSEAEQLLGTWVKAVLDIHDAESILLFAKRQLAKNRLWPTAVLLEAFSNKKHCPAEARFEAQALRCSALGELSKLLRVNDIAKKGLIAEVQVDWVASVGKDDVDKMFADSMDQAGCCFANLSESTESQHALKKHLEKIAKEINQAKNKQ